MNQLALDFCESLFAGFHRWPISEQTRALYRDRISQWRLEPAEWISALDRILAETKEESLPQLETIYAFLRNATPGRASITRDCWLWYTTKEGARGVVKLKDPMTIPDVPEGATDIHVVVPPHLEARNPEDQPRKRDVNALLRKATGQP